MHGGRGGKGVACMMVGDLLCILCRDGLPVWCAWQEVESAVCSSGEGGVRSAVPSCPEIGQP